MTGNWWEYLAVFAASAVTSTLLTPVALMVATRAGILDNPGGHKSHDSPVPYLGGVAIVVAFAGVVVGAALLKPPISGLDELVTVLLLGIVLAFVGLADDLWNLAPVVRVVVEIVFALQLWRMETGVHLTGSPAIDIVLTVVWVVGITNAFNLLDNMDGLAAGQAAICASTMFAVAVANGQVLVGALSVALIGCAVGFLRLNFHPAKIYMGDGGALFLGFMVAYLGLKLQFESSVSESFLVPVVACAIPVLDTSLVTFSRLSTGRSPFRGGRDHISHRLVHVGLPIPVAVGLTYVSAAALGVVSFVVSRVDAASAWILSGLVAGLLVLAGILLSLIPVYPESMRKHYFFSER